MLSGEHKRLFKNILKNHTDPKVLNGSVWEILIHVLDMLPT